MIFEQFIDIGLFRRFPERGESELRQWNDKVSVLPDVNVRQSDAELLVLLREGHGFSPKGTRKAAVPEIPFLRSCL